MIAFSNRISSDHEFYWCRSSVFGQTKDVYYEIIEMDDTPENRTYLSLTRNIISFYNIEAIKENNRVIPGIHMFYPGKLKNLLEKAAGEVTVPQRGSDNGIISGRDHLNTT